MSKADIKTRKTVNIKYPDRFKIVILNDDYNIANIINGVSLLNKYINIYENKYNLINLVY